ELAPRRHVVEQVADLDRGAARVLLRRHVTDVAAVDLEARAVVVTVAPGRQDEAAHRRNRRQRLAAESQGGDGFEIIERGDLAGRVPRNRQRQFGRRDAAAVVADPDQAYATFFQVDVDPARAGVERVLDQFLDHGRGPLDDFAGGDLVHEG